MCWGCGERLKDSSPLFPKGALTHHPITSGGGIPFGAVRSARRMRLLREPYGQCCISAELSSLSTQLVIGVSTYAESLRFQHRDSTNCSHKPATGSLVCGDGSTHSIEPFSFEKETKRKDGDTQWQFTIWKQKSSAVELDAPLWLLPLT